MRRANQMFGTTSVPRSTQATTKNKDGYPAFERPVEEQYVQCLLTNTLGQTFYADSRDLLKEADALHQQMVKADPAFVAKALAFARKRGFMRTQPILGLSHLAGVKEAPFAQTFNDVIFTPNDLADFLTMIRSMRKGPVSVSFGGKVRQRSDDLRGSQGGSRIKKAAGKWLIEKLGEYWTVKYGAEKKGGAYSLKQMIQVLHPDAKGQKLPLFDYIMEREGASLAELPQIQAFEALKSAKTPEEKIKAIIDGRLPHEVATTFAGKDAKVWEAIVPNLPIFALLKNLATLERHGVLESNRKLISGKFADAATIQKSKILPYRFLEARKHVNAAWAQDALRDGLDLSFGNFDDIEGRSAVFLDISGSMESYIQTAAIFAVCLMKKTGGDGRFLCYDTQLDEVKVSMRDSTLTQAERIHARGETNTSLPMKKLLSDRDKVDNIILITDEQQNMGAPFIDALDEYRRKVNRNVRCFVINVAPYHGSLMPVEGNTYYIYGWSDQVLQFVSMASKGWGSQVDAIRQGVAS